MIITVHPHVCGELTKANVSYEANDGSSPRVWGTPYDRCEAVLSDRFIPTCVGNSLSIHDAPVLNTVHPHVCGELLGTIVKIDGTTG